MDPRIKSIYWTLRIGLGTAAFLAGLDKFFNILANWELYLSPVAKAVLPFSDVVFMRIAGVIEMAAGAILLAGLTRFGGYLVMAWLIAIALQLVTTGHYFDVAVRDVTMAIAAFTLARLTEAGAGADARVHAEARGLFGGGAKVTA